MPHPEVENRTPFVFEAVHLSNEDGRPLLVATFKATYDIHDGSSLELAEVQSPLQHSGEHWGEPGQSSFRFEPEASWLKPGTDVALVAHAWAPHAGTNAMDVGFSLGSLRKTARVFGDRTWYKRITSGITTPKPFERIPLIYENTFGGWDRSPFDPSKHTFDQRNPFGRGFRSKDGRFEEGLPLASIEDPRSPVRSVSDRPEPVGFGFTSPHWQPRAGYAGTYDEAWSDDRSPLLPVDFDRRFLNGASSGLVAQGYLRGDEPVRGSGVSRTGRLAFSLPGQPPPTVRVQLRSRDDESPSAKLDTVIVDTDDNKLILIWRAELLMDDGPHDVVSIEVDAPAVRRKSDS